MIEAFTECVAEVGIEKATYRLVAERAQVGLGTVQHYFPNKSEMINEALMVEHRASQRRHETIEPGVQPRNLTDAIEQRFARSLYLTEEEQAMLPFYIEYWAHASRDPSLRTFHHDRWAQVEADVRDQLASGIADEVLQPILNPADIAATLIALISGLNTNIALHPVQYPADRVRSILHAVTNALLAEEPAGTVDFTQ